MPLDAPAAVQTELVRAVEAAASLWRTPCAAIQIDVGASAERSRGAVNDGVNTVVLQERLWCRRGRRSGPCYRPAELAVTTVFNGSGPAARDEIVEADIELNGVHHAWFAGSEHPALPVPSVTVLAHELGHVLGFDHPHEDGTPGSIMAQAIHDGLAGPEGPTPADLEALCRAYPDPPRPQDPPSAILAHSQPREHAPPSALAVLLVGCVGVVAVSWFVRAHRRSVDTHRHERRL
jgi:hypothetical protein